MQYGPNVRALGVHLTQGQMLPYARAAELIHDVYGLTTSPATLLAWVAEARGPASDGGPHCRAVACRAGPERRRVRPARGWQTALVAHRRQRDADLVWRTRQAGYGGHRGAWHPAQAPWRAGARLLGAVLAA